VVEKLPVLYRCQELLPSCLSWLGRVRGMFCSQWEAQLSNDPFASTDSWLKVLALKSPLRLEKNLCPGKLISRFNIYFLISNKA